MENFSLVTHLCDETEHQRCEMNADVMQSSSLYLNTPALIQLTNVGGQEDGAMLCYVWPSDTRSKTTISVEPTVISSYFSWGFSPPTGHTIHHSQIKAICDIKICPRVTVVVVLRDYRKVAAFLQCANNLLTLKPYIKDMLKGYVIGKNFDYRCSSSQLGTLYGISALHIEDVALENDLCGKVTGKTKFIVSKVVSEETYVARLKAKARLPKLGGLDVEMSRISEIVNLASSHKRNLAKQLGVPVPKAMLIRGPPGCGKTSLVKAVAEECGGHLMVLNGGEVFGARPGETEDTLSEIFYKARTLSGEGLCILFIDELDALCPTRSKKTAGPERRVVLHLAKLMDDIPQNCSLVVVGATSRPDVIDPSLRRLGRFEKEIFIGMPKLTQRQKILECITESIPQSDCLDLEFLASATPGFTGADLASLTQQALLNHTPSNGGLSMSAMQHALHTYTPSSQRGSDVLVDHHPVQWNDIGGLELVKTQIKQAVEWPLQHPEAFQRLGLLAPKGVLLYGPPGCAKTTLVKAAATSCHVTFLALNGAQLYSPFVGDSEKKLAEVFQQARAGAPTILFIDEIDALVGKRSEGSGQSGVRDRVLSTLLNEMDGIGLRVDTLRHSQSPTAEGESSKSASSSSSVVDNNSVTVVAATNRPDMVDGALLRPGRLDRIIYVPPPDQPGRKEILKVFTKKMPMEELDYDDLADRTEGFTGADIENLCRETGLIALGEGGLESPITVKVSHFDSALSKMSPSLTPFDILRYSTLQRTLQQSVHK